MKILPTTPGPQSAKVRAIDFGSTLTPPLGGTDQRINRLGNRWAIDVTMPVIINKNEGMAFVARLVRGKTEGLRMEFPLNGFNPGSPGSPVVNGSSQAGRVLNMTGFTPNYTVQEGQFFSIFSGGVHYLYQSDEIKAADASGVLSLTINPLLRVSPASGDVCNFAVPMIEGLVEGRDWQWDYAVAGVVGIEFSIKERK